jgi:glutathione S-transferase
MKVFGHPMSTCTRKVLTVLAEKGHKADFVLVDLTKGEHKQGDHLARQPFGQVPTLDDDGFSLYESRAICRYLDETLPGPKLHGADAKSRAVIEQWVSVETSNFTPHAMKIIMQLFFAPMMGKEPDQATVASGREGLDRVLPVMERQLAKTPYIAGKEFTVADIGFLPYIDYLFAAKAADQIEAQPSVLAWWKRISDRASWKVATGK